MTDQERIRRHEQDNEILMGLLGLAIRSMADPAAHIPGGSNVWRYAGERPVRRLLQAIETGPELRP